MWSRREDGHQDITGQVSLGSLSNIQTAHLELRIKVMLGLESKELSICKWYLKPWT
jgi:hypothetical protein